ncbi:hypothetical protein SPRG_09389 [Saprolegnia parasitica CBS 223.65]|uniref:FYVE-type domain-containing protein n=1 Tax=Saprolegnia parasitica (strain CBS 223.65) TaxID=695850 RepID=A0A067CFW0_SAPPC|nr:hypothetical protein SPRG_09389 [Saprolegnia parasitica CBS 223.65]KDO25446.1 hypothetical protein SPRG_09389 [Saprolegnia parasitica CBS 223.65]|eukprot:XP_012203872.1 hypothetical protein SPRG_09389 [Saprolegnia parasitica CBS 223.65]
MQLPALLHVVADADWPRLLAALTELPQPSPLSCDGSGLSVLHWACLHRDVPAYIMVAILNVFPDAAATAAPGGDTPFALATRRMCRQQVLNVLFAACPDADCGTKAAVHRCRPLPPRWQEDVKCGLCLAAFTPARRRHHCRNCGLSVCAAHSQQKASLAMIPAASPQRLCDVCASTLAQFADLADNQGAE